MEVNLNIDVMKEHLAQVTQEKTKEKNVNQDHSSESRLTKMYRFKSSLSFDDYKWLLQAHSIVASFYNSVNNQKGCEKSYVKYIQLIEKFYYQDSLEASNAYFMVGVYYFEENIA